MIKTLTLSAFFFRKNLFLLTLFFVGFGLTGKAQTALVPGVPQTTTMDEPAFGFIMCGNTGFGNNDETKRFSYVSTLNSPCSTLDLTGITNDFTGIFIFEDNLPVSAATPCIGEATNGFSTADLSVTFNMVSGKTYYFVVTNYDESGTLGFTINLTLGTALPTPNVLMNPSINNTTLEIADGTTTYFYDSGGPNCDYKLNENYTLTVCPDAAGVSADKVVQLEFTNFNRDGNCLTSSEITFYKGTTATPGNEIFPGEYANIIYTEDVRIFTAIVTGGCMTIVWVNGNDTNCEGEGWEGNFQLIDNPCTTSTFSDDCASAARLLIGESMSSTSECFTSGSSACGIGSNNDSWFKFTASATTVEIAYAITGGNACYASDVPNNDLSSTTNGLQFLLYEGCGAAQQICTTVVTSTGGIDVEAGTYASGTWTINSLTVGMEYYAQFDSYGSDLCNFTVTGGAGLVLPVELLSFSARLTNGHIALNWSTASEQNNNGFEIQRSTDGVNFYKIGWIDGEGNSDREVAYQYTDNEVKSNTKYYYRLRQIDFDGAEDFSQIETVRTAGKEDVVSIQPNPVAIGNDVQININATSAQDGQVLLFDITGREVLNQSFATVKGDNIIDLPMQDVTNGNYFVKVILGNNTHYQKLIVQ